MSVAKDKSFFRQAEARAFSSGVLFMLATNRQQFLFAIAIALSSMNSTASEKPARQTPLTESGQKLAAKYADILKSLQAEIQLALPIVDEQSKSTFLKAREAVRQATKEANAAQQSEGKIQTAKALVEHARGKWIGGADKGIAQAEAALKKAATDAEREAAKKDLEKWKANKEDGLKALKERQEAYDKAKLDEKQLTDANNNSHAALARAQKDEQAAAQAILAAIKSTLSSDKLDTKLVKCVVLAEATPKGLAEFAQQDHEQQALVIPCSPTTI
jgi:hypothetical protein